MISRFSARPPGSRRSGTPSKRSRRTQMDCYLALRRSSSSIGRVDVTASRCHAAMSNAFVCDTRRNSVRDASLDGTTHCCQSGGTHEPGSTCPVQSSPGWLGLGDAIGILPMPFAAPARRGPPVWNATSSRRDLGSIGWPRDHTKAVALLHDSLRVGVVLDVREIVVRACESRAPNDASASGVAGCQQVSPSLVTLACGPVCINRPAVSDAPAGLVGELCPAVAARGLQLLSIWLRAERGVVPPGGPSARGGVRCRFSAGQSGRIVCR
jgi:hypothetical protein